MSILSRPVSLSEWHSLSATEVLQRLAVEAQKGLTHSEVSHRFKQYGYNKLPVTKREGFFLRLAKQLHNPLFYLLEAASLVTFLLKDYIDAGVILSMVIINVVIGLIQEGKASKALEALHAMLSIKASVLHEGKRHEEDATLLVPGDIVFLSPGAWVPADLRLLETKNLRINEASLTGESNPSKKSTETLTKETPVAERYNMAYASTVVTNGTACGVVVNTGINTEIGRIHRLMSETRTLSTPLSRRLDHFAKQMTIFIILMGILTFIYGYFLGRLSTLDLFLAIVGFAVASIPEGLPAIVIIVLTIGTRFMVRHNVIVRRFPAVEALGSVTVICSDKTGTLTKNEMEVVEVLLPEKTSKTQEIQALARCALLCNDAYFKEVSGQEMQLVGDPTEMALWHFADKIDINASTLLARMPRIETIPFESEHRFMATLHRDEMGATFIFLKGAPEVVFNLCVGIDRAEWEKRMDACIRSGKRMLALAYYECASDIEDFSVASLKPEFNLLGLVALIDPPRIDAIAAVKVCQEAGLDIKMVTGDHKLTAIAIALQLGLKPEDVVARATPEDKLRLVQNLQAQGELVAVTGDGVNDAPALRAADIGIAMGKRGTDAAREASDLVLTDDNFATIAHAVREGRVIYDNIKKSLLFTLAMNGSEAGVIFLAVLLGLELPITVGQILWVNIVIEMTLGFTLAFEPAEADVMLRGPRAPTQPLLTRLLIARIMYASALAILSTFIVFKWELFRGGSVEMARTAAVNMLVLGGLFYLFNVRRFTASAVVYNIFTENKKALLMGIILIGLQLIITYVPVMQEIFHTVGLDGMSWIVIFVLAFCKFFAVELEKAVLRYFGIQHM